MLDVLIQGGTVVDGTGAVAATGDVAIRGDRIVSVGGRIDEPAMRRIDADGCLVTPGFVDVHTHYDGQVTWDDAIEPSASNGVTTVVMGNCGVGFAPMRPGTDDALIDLMEGVEDIPGTALHAGMPWGEWESFADYLDVLAGRQYSVDVGAQLAHGALRFYVMGERGAANEDATADDLAQMAALTSAALDAGAVGFSTSRTIGHRSVSGRPVPGTFAPTAELVAIAQAMREAGHGVFEAIVAGTIGPLAALGGERATPLDEFPLLADVARAGGRPVTFTTVQLFDTPDLWRELLDRSSTHNATAGSDVGTLRPQVIPRSVTIMTSLDTYHLFQGRPSYRAIAHVALAERVALMRQPAVRQAILAEAHLARDDANLFTNLAGLFQLALPVTFPMSETVSRPGGQPTIDYEPSLTDSVAAQAGALGKDPEAHMYDLLLTDGGNAFYAVLGSNFAGGNLEVCRDMMLDPNTVTGLSDAGAHVKLISDCSASTFHLTHWVRDRTAGERLPVELMVRKLSGNNAELYGFGDRGTLVPGKRADVNVIDLDRLRIHRPELRNDLPAGAGRILQRSTGYVATMVAGDVVRDHDEDTGVRPGRLVRGRCAGGSTS